MIYTIQTAEPLLGKHDRSHPSNCYRFWNVFFDVIVHFFYILRIYESYAIFEK